MICKNIKPGIESLSQVCKHTFIELWPAPGHVSTSHVPSKPNRFLLQLFEVFSALTHGFWSWHRNPRVGHICINLPKLIISVLHIRKLKAFGNE